MTVLRLDNIGVVVDDLESARAFFVELGLEPDGEASVEGPWVDRCIGLEDARADIVMMKTPEGHSRLELTKFHSPEAIDPEAGAPANALGIRRIMFAVDDIAFRRQFVALSETFGGSKARVTRSPDQI